MISWRPDESVEVPDAIVRRAAHRPIEAVWRNGLGGLTFRLGGDVAEEYVKWMSHESAIDFSLEARKLDWAVQHETVPRVLECGHDEIGAWLATTALPGTNAVEERWRADPAHAVTIIGRSLRTWHDRLSVADCPFAWTAASRVAVAKRRHDLGLLDWSAAIEHFGDNSVDELFAELSEVPPEDLVVCHGDACAPNTLIDDDGTCSGHVDLDQMGVGDRWADIAIAAWSTVWNYGEGYEDMLYAAYGIERDDAKIRYYRLLWDLG